MEEASLTETTETRSCATSLVIKNTTRAHRRRDSRLLPRNQKPHDLKADVGVGLGRHLALGGAYDSVALANKEAPGSVAVTATA